MGARNSLGRSLLTRDTDVETRLEFIREACELNSWHCATTFALWQHDEPDDATFLSSLEKARSSPYFKPHLQPALLGDLVRLYDPEGTVDTAVSYEFASQLADLYARHYYHAVPFDPASLHRTWRRCAESDERCAAGLDEVLGQGTGPELLSALLK